MGIKIIADSVSDIPKEISDKYGITILPLLVSFGDESFRDGIDIKENEFFERLKVAKELPKTSQVTPGAFAQEFEKEISKGNEVIAILLSSELSGTYGAAVMAKEMVGSGMIHVVDSRNASFACGMMVIEAAKMVVEGYGASEIVDEIMRMVPLQKTYVMFDTLEYLAKGGRLSSGKATIGNILNIKAILEISDGKIVPIDKVRGRKKFAKWVIEKIEKEGYDISDKWVAFFSARGDDDLIPSLIEEIRAKFGFKESTVSHVGGVVGTYTGPGCIAVTFNLTARRPDVKKYSRA